MGEQTAPDWPLVRATRDTMAERGLLSETLEGYRPRVAQQHLAEAIAVAISTAGELVAEAGTGTGKTYAYLVPALLSGQRTIISTGTRALQDQLYQRDLPRVRDALGARLKSALLKGRSNYLCWYRMERTRAEGHFASRELVAQLNRIHAWAQATDSGDLAELDFLPEDSSLRPRITSTAENCLGVECPFYEQCFVVRARQRAQEADLVVVNHHLLFADQALKREGFGEILPGAASFVLDEAHLIPELAAQFFGSLLSSRQLADLARDSIAECASVEATLILVQEPVQVLEQALREFRLALEGVPQRAALGTLQGRREVEAARDGLQGALDGLEAVLRSLAERSVGFKACHERAVGFVDSLRSLFQPDGEGEVRWYEVTARGFRLHQTPLDVSATLQAFRAESRAAWIHTSATLTVDGRFDHFNRQLGLVEPAAVLEESPFDYHNQALLYVPEGLPEPNTESHVQAVIEAALPLLDMADGRAFLLFTSHRALREAAVLLEERREFPLFVQGTAPRHHLLEQFRVSGNGVLLGAASFWSGVDVPGDALQIVVIDKLPFASPGDPVLQARLAAIREQGGVPFRDWQLPVAVLALKQGAGRLIRSPEDRGVLVLCDPRLVSRSYGRLFLDSLPPFARTRDLQRVLGFLRDSRLARG